MAIRPIVVYPDPVLLEPTRPVEVFDDDGSPVDTPLGTWDLVMDVNAKGVFLGCKFGIPALRRAGGGSIIMVSSA